MFMATLADSIARHKSGGIAMIASGVLADRIQDAISRCWCVLSKSRLSISSMSFIADSMRMRPRSQAQWAIGAGLARYALNSRANCPPSVVMLADVLPPPLNTIANTPLAVYSVGCVSMYWTWLSR
jgi:hypothetical protein